MGSQAYFDEIASQWDSMRKSFFSEALREKAYGVAGVQPGKLAADLGAGSGFITEGLLRIGLRVVAVDQSESMLAEMRRKFGDDPRLETRQGSAESLPLADQSIDYAFANMYLHHVEHPLESIREMARILKPGGVLVITDLDEHNYEFLRAEQYDRWLGFKRSDIQSWFVEAGMEQVMVDCAGEDCCADSSCGSVSARVSIFVAYGVKTE